MYKFTDRKPQLPYRKKNIEVQFWQEIEEARETEIIKLEGGGAEEKVIAYFYNKYTLPWREEFNQATEYDQEGNLIKQDYITDNYMALLTEAKEQVKFVLKNSR